jgi:uncharacterized membrane protein
MNLWSLVGAIVFGSIFAFFTFWGVETLDSHTTRGVVSVFLFGFYCAVVILGTSDKKRTLSVLNQTLLGIAFSCAIAAIFGASLEGYFLAAALGLVFGFTADMWVKHVQIP